MQATTMRPQGRGRVGKACERCRIKKSKCDGENPCNKCVEEDSVCVYSFKKKSQKSYPIGYVELLEEQQDRLVTALKELYRRLDALESDGDQKDKETKLPSTQEILKRLGLEKAREAERSQSPEVSYDDAPQRRVSSSLDQPENRRASRDEITSPTLDANGSMLFPIKMEDPFDNQTLMATTMPQSDNFPDVSFQPPAPGLGYVPQENFQWDAYNNGDNYQTLPNQSYPNANSTFRQQGSGMMFSNSGWLPDSLPIFAPSSDSTF